MTKRRSPAYAYVRVSSTGQMKGHGPERQEEIIREWAAGNGYDVRAVYSDAWTGKEGDRPAFAKMMAEMMGNGVKTVIVESLDRFARDLFVQSLLLAKLGAEGLTLVAANTGEDVTAAMTEDPMRRAMVQIQGVFAELDRNLVVRRLRLAREDIRDKGKRCEGRRPYGDKEGEAAVVERMRQMRTEQRMSLGAIAAKLNEEGVKPRYAERWAKTTVGDVLARLGVRKGLAKTPERDANAQRK